MNESTLLLEVGSEALNDLTAAEKGAILNKYSETQVKLAGMKVFGLLTRKFQPNYRMGRLYESLSQKYEMYYKLYRHYAATVSAGKLGHTDLDDKKVIENDKFLDTHKDLGDL